MQRVKHMAALKCFLKRLFFEIGNKVKMLGYKNGIFYYKCDFSDNDYARSLGFSWNTKYRVWTTPYLEIAAKINPSHPSLMLAKKETDRTYSASMAVSTTFCPQAPKGLHYLSYQAAGIEFMKLKKRVLLADQMGLGKTIQAIGLCNELRPENVLVICPASLKINWAREFEKWRTYEVKPVILNYDILKKHQEYLKSKIWDVLILDECHFLKNPKAQRTKLVMGLNPIKTDRVLALTGTPVLNKPIELFTILNYLMPAGFPNRFFYAKRYCAAKKTFWGWDFNGASNLEELQKLLRSTVMIRRLKKDVLADLPTKFRQIIEFEEEASKTEQNFFIKVFAKVALKAQAKLTASQFKEAIRLMSGGSRILFEEMSRIRKENAQLKAPHVIKHLTEALDSSEKIIVFCHHIEMAKRILNAFKRECVMVIGETLLEQRDVAVRAFQENPAIRVFIGNIQAAGTGLTLTASSHVVFAESSWVPGELNQAEDRCHRIGQKNAVLIQHLVLRNSIDATMIKRVIEKQELIEAALDDPLLSDLLK